MHFAADVIVLVMMIQVMPVMLVAKMKAARDLRGKRGCIRAVDFAVFLLAARNFLCFVAALRRAVLVTFRSLKIGRVAGKREQYGRILQVSFESL